MSEQTLACPHCDGPNAIPRTDDINQDRAPDTDWRCKDCGAEFDTPIERECKGTDTRPPSHSLAADLLEMDADEIGGSSA